MNKKTPPEGSAGDAPVPPAETPATTMPTSAEIPPPKGATLSNSNKPGKSALKLEENAVKSGGLVKLTLDPSDSEKLAKLKEQIHASHESCHRCVLSVRERMVEGTADAIRCGNALASAKTIVGHGKWLAWFQEHCHAISERTAQVYMQMAKAQTSADLNLASSIKHVVALLSDGKRVHAAKAAPPPDQEDSGKSAKGTSPVADPVHLIRSLAATLERALYGLPGECKREAWAALSGVRHWIAESGAE